VNFASPTTLRWLQPFKKKREDELVPKSVFRLLALFEFVVFVNNNKIVLAPAMKALLRWEPVHATESTYKPVGVLVCGHNSVL
jgi:hypothetical protein